MPLMPAITRIVFGAAILMSGTARSEALQNQGTWKLLDKQGNRFWKVGSVCEKIFNR